MKYIKEDIEFTGSKDYFKNGFLEEGVCYDEVYAGIVSGLVNHTEIIKSYICKKYTENQDIKFKMTTTSFIENQSKFTLSTMNKTNICYPHDANDSVIITFMQDEKEDNLKKWVDFRNNYVDIHTRLAEVDEELMICKAEDLDNVYLFFWFSRTRDNSVCRFVTDDSVEDIIKEFERYLEEDLEFKTRYEILPENYKGWLSNI